MYFFLCYAFEDRNLVAPVHALLTAKGHHVFFDQHALPPGQEFHDRIRTAIEECDLFIFFLSTSSVRYGRFCLTELEWAAVRWPDPAGHVLPVCLDPKLPALPRYLANITVLHPRGNVETSVLWATSLRSRMSPRRSLAVAQALDMLVWGVRSLFMSFVLSLVLGLGLGLSQRRWLFQTEMVGLFTVVTLCVFAWETFLRRAPRLR